MKLHNWPVLFLFMTPVYVKGDIANWTTFRMSRTIEDTNDKKNGKNKQTIYRGVIYKIVSLDHNSEISAYKLFVIIILLKLFY